MKHIYYDIDLYNYINNRTIHYNRKITNCITLIKIIEENYDKISCKSKILKYINRLFQNNYKIKDTNSIKINFNNKELYFYNNNNKIINNEYANNIKLNIEYVKQINENINKIKIRNWDIKKINKYRKFKEYIIKYGKFDINKGFKRYIENINILKEGLGRNINGKTFFCYINNKVMNDSGTNSDIDISIEIKLNKEDEKKTELCKNLRADANESHAA